jgi:hypothetical protein
MAVLRLVYIDLLTKLCYSSSSFHNVSTILVCLVLEYGLVMQCRKNTLILY